jgi:hypothetical protein
MAGDLTITIPRLAGVQRALGQAPALVEKELRGTMGLAVEVTKSEVERRTPVDRGDLRGATVAFVRGSPVTALQGVIANPTSYAIPVERGTRPHEIRPRNGRFLRFVVNGREVFARVVRHPGTKGAWMFRDGAKAAYPKVVALFGQAMQRVAAAIARGAR